MRPFAALVLSAACAAAPRNEPRFAPPPPEVPVELHVVAESVSYYEVFPAGSVTLISLPWALAVGSRERIDVSDRLAEKLGASPHQLAGSWPHILATHPFGPPIGASPAVAAWRGDRWERLGALAPFDKLLAVAPFHGGALVIADLHLEGAPDELRAFGTTAKPPVLEPASAEGCKTRVRPAFLRTRASGEVLVLGVACGSTEPLLERWSGGEHAVEPLPAVAGAEIAIVAFHASETTLFAAGFATDSAARSTPYFARRDQVGWHLEKVPVTEEVRSMSLLPDGTVLALGARAPGVELARRSAAGAWSTVEVRAPSVRSLRMSAAAEDDLWVIARDESAPSDRRNVLLHSRPLGAPLRDPR